MKRKLAVLLMIVAVAFGVTVSPASADTLGDWTYGTPTSTYHCGPDIHPTVAGDGWYNVCVIVNSAGTWQGAVLWTRANKVTQQIATGIYDYPSWTHEGGCDSWGQFGSFGVHATTYPSVWRCFMPSHSQGHGISVQIRAVVWDMQGVWLGPYYSPMVTT